MLMQLCHIAIAQSDREPHHGHQHHHNEIGMANAMVLLAAETEFAYGLHMHYTHVIRHTKWLAGFGFEHIFDEHRHQAYSTVVAFRPTGPLTFSAAPGLATEGGNFRQARFTLHIECTYEWELGDFHLGPMAEAAYEAEGMHFALGAHLGVGF